MPKKYNTKTIKISDHLNNCAFHTLVPFIFTLLGEKSIKNSGFSFNELQPTAKEKNAFKKTEGFKYFKKAFAGYFHLDNMNRVEVKIKKLLQQHSHPLDLQVLLGPVLRLTLKSVLLNNTDHRDMITESFQRLLQQCINHFDAKEPAYFQSNPVYIQQWLSELDLGEKHEFDELFFPDLSIIAQYLASKDRPSQAEMLVDKAYEQYVAYQCNINQGVFVSHAQLEMLCHSFQFNFAIDGYQKFSPESELNFKPLAKVKISNTTKTHWEIISNKGSEWNYDKTSEKLPSRLTYYYNQVKKLSGTSVFSSQVAVLQDTLRAGVKQCIIDSEPFNQPIYTVLPNDNWSNNGGLEHLVSLIKEVVVDGKALTIDTEEGLGIKFQSTPGFGEFLENFRQYYLLDKEFLALWDLSGFRSIFEQ